MSTAENPHGPPSPSREFYLSDPRSAEIRGTCIAFICTVDGLLYTARDEHERVGLYGQTELLNGRLIELGVQRNMHVREPKHPIDFFWSNPVSAAEYLAGQLLILAGDTIIPYAEAAPIIREFSEDIALGVYLHDSKILPKAHKFEIQQGIVEFARDGFAVSPEELEQDR